MIIITLFPKFFEPGTIFKLSEEKNRDKIYSDEKKEASIYSISSQYQTIWYYFYGCASYREVCLSYSIVLYIESFDFPLLTVKK